ncbi:MAG TPA: hypothetical protein VET23_00750, partial [Chitinophagaceae bacterium]|nr:hypothetical protein [Chitinophagaceae bacterium]
MNPQLQAILDAIQNNADLNGSEKEALVKKIKEADKSQSLVQFKLDRLERDKQTLSVMLDESIEDLQKKSRAVEEKNRELEIESSLERVRTVAMSMNKPDDMLNVCHIISDQLKLLQIQDIRNVQTIVINESKFEYINYQYFTPYDKNSIEQIDYRLHPVELELAQKMLSSPDAFYSKIFRGNDLQVWRDHRRATHQLPDPLLDEVDSAYYYFFSIGSGALGVTAYSQLTDEALIVFKRFRNVFELAYRRYIDIEKAEAQARESQIQLALERVRARTMAMQKSDELSEAVYILFQQFRELGENPDQATIGVINEKKHVIEYWVTMYGNQMNKVFKFSIDEPNVTNKIYNAWKEGKKSLVIDLSGKNLSEFMAYRAGKGGAAINPNERRRIINIAFFSKGLLNVQSNEQRSEESIKLLERFAAVFEQTYTRFLDLQKAEAQAREAQIEAALERVRSRTMGMQKSDELQSAAL